LFAVLYDTQHVVQATKYYHLHSVMMVATLAQNAAYFEQGNVDEASY